MSLPGESPNIILEGVTQLLPATLQILGVVGLHVCALEVASEDLLEILLAINHVSRQVVQPSSSPIGQVNGEELDDEEVIIHPACPARDVLVLQPNARVCLTILFDNVIRCPKTFWKICVMHVAPECVGPWPLRAEGTPLSVVMPAATWVT
jgi:hypothetical protein